MDGKIKGPPAVGRMSLAALGFPAPRLDALLALASKSTMISMLAAPSPAIRGCEPVKSSHGADAQRSAGGERDDCAR